MEAHLKLDYSTAKDRFVTPLEKDLVKIFESKPSVTDAATRAVWTKFGIFNLTEELDGERMKIDKRVPIDKEVKKSGRTYDGQMSFYGGPKEEHGIGRI